MDLYDLLSIAAIASRCNNGEFELCCIQNEARMKYFDGILRFVQKNQVKPPKEPPSTQLVFFNDSGNSLFPEYFEESSTCFETFMSIGDHFMDNSHSLLDVFSGKVLEAQIISKSWSKSVMAEHISNFLTCIGLKNFKPVVLLISPGDRRDYASLGRYFCQIANDEEVRSILKASFNINIPLETVFIHVCHDKERNRFNVSRGYPLTGQHQVHLNYFGKKSEWVTDRYLRYNAHALDEVILAKDKVLIICGSRSLTKGLYLNGDVFIQSYDYSNDLSCGQLFKLIEALKAKSKLTKSSFTSRLILVEQRTENLLDVYLRLKDRDLLNPKQTRFATIDPETKEIEFLRETLVSECGEQC